MFNLLSNTNINIHGKNLLNSLFFCTDEDDEPRCVTLTAQHKAAIRFIRKVNYYYYHERHLLYNNVRNKKDNIQNIQTPVQLHLIPMKNVMKVMRSIVNFSTIK